MMIKLLITKEEEKKLEALSPSAVKFHEFLRENNGYSLSPATDSDSLTELVKNQLVEQYGAGVKLSGCNIVRTPDGNPLGDAFTVHYYRTVPHGVGYAIQRFRGCAEHAKIEYYTSNQYWGSRDNACLFFTEDSAFLMIRTLPPARLSRPFQEGDYIQTRITRVVGTVVKDEDNPNADIDGTVVTDAREEILSGVVSKADDGYGWLTVEWGRSLFANPNVFIADADMVMKLV